MLSSYDELIEKYKYKWDEFKGTDFEKALELLRDYCGFDDFFAIRLGRNYKDPITDLISPYYGKNGHLSKRRDSLYCDIRYLLFQIIIKILPEKFNARKGDLGAILQTIINKTYILPSSIAPQLIHAIILEGKNFENLASDGVKNIKALSEIVKTCFDVSNYDNFFDIVLTKQFNNDWQIELIIEAIKQIVKEDYSIKKYDNLVFQIFRKALDDNYHFVPNSLFEKICLKINVTNTTLLVKILELEYSKFKEYPEGFRYYFDYTKAYFSLCCKKEFIANWDQVENNFIAHFDLPNLNHVLFLALQDGSLATITHLLTTKKLNLTKDRYAIIRWHEDWRPWFPDVPSIHEIIMGSPLQAAICIASRSEKTLTVLPEIVKLFLQYDRKFVDVLDSKGNDVFYYINRYKNSSYLNLFQYRSPQKTLPSRISETLKLLTTAKNSNECFKRVGTFFYCGKNDSLVHQLPKELCDIIIEKMAKSYGL